MGNINIDINIRLIGDLTSLCSLSSLFYVLFHVALFVSCAQQQCAGDDKATKTPKNEATNTTSLASDNVLLGAIKPQYTVIPGVLQSYYK